MGVLVLVAIFIIALGMEEAPGQNRIHSAKRVQRVKRTAPIHHQGKYRTYTRKGA